MRILAIDPGNEESAYVLWDKKIIEKGIYLNADLLYKLRAWDHDYLPCVIEMIASYGMPVGKTVFETCVWIGRFAEAWRSPVHYIYRKDVKINLCNSMRAKDSNIRQAIIDRYGKPGTIKNPNINYGETNKVEDKIKADMWAALAVALTYEDLR